MVLEGFNCQTLTNTLETHTHKPMGLPIPTLYPTNNRTHVLTYVVATSSLKVLWQVNLSLPFYNYYVNVSTSSSNFASAKLTHPFPSLLCQDSPYFQRDRDFLVTLADPLNKRLLSIPVTCQSDHYPDSSIASLQTYFSLSYSWLSFTLLILRLDSGLLHDLIILLLFFSLIIILLVT